EQDSLKHLQCLLCGQIANSAMELSCDKHKDSEDTLLVGEKCLIEYLYENNNQCPVEKHGTCSYTRANTIMRIICDLNVICPRQFMNHFDQEAIIQKKEEDITTKTVHVCNFEGKIGSIKKHLENTCPLKPLECKFKKFGCNAEQHVQSLRNKRTSIQLALISFITNFHKSEEEKIQVILQHWIRLLQVKFGWINEFNKIVADYVSSFAVYGIDHSTFDDCQLICSGSYDKTVRIWDIDNNKEVELFKKYLSK
ncbi:hypothetical protein RFI_28961, partial [Reticulomyxa filosa]